MRISPQSIEFGLWCNGSTTGFGSVCLGSNPGKPTEKEQWNPLLFFCLNNSRHVIFPIPLFVAIAPLFLPYILRYKTQGRSAQCILIPKLKRHFQSSPPVFPLGNIGGECEMYIPFASAPMLFKMPHHVTGYGRRERVKKHF